MNFFSSKLELFGLDISDSCLKFAMLKNIKHEIKLVSFEQAKVPLGIIDGGEIKKEQALAEVIKKALLKIKGERITTRNVVATLPEEKSFLDIIQVPQVEDNKLESTVRFEAANHIPVSLEQVCFDFEKIPALANQVGRKEVVEVLIAATPKTIVEPYVRVLKMAGLRPLALEIESLAIVRALIKKDSSQKPILIIDFGGSKTSFLIFAGRNLRFTSSIPISSKGLTEVLSQKLKLTFQQAEKLKIAQGLTNKKQAFKIMAPLLLDLVGQIRIHLGYYRSHVAKAKLLDSRTLNKILLCGSGANLKGLPNFLADQLKIEVELGNPWINILKKPLEKTPELSFEKSLGFTTVLGLALRNFYD